MTAKFSASADGTKVYLGNASENALELDATGKKIKPVAPFTFDFSNLPFSKTNNGYLTLPNGFILQWGNTDTLTTNFPVPFPNTPLRVLASLNWLSNEAAAGAFQLVNTFTPTSFTLGNAASALTPPGSVTWIAIGY